MTPALAILQGAIGILNYRNMFGDAPLPQTPSHGVVVVHPDDKAKEEVTSSTTTSNETSTTTTTATQELQKLCPQRRPIAGLSLPSLGCECTTRGGGGCNLPAIMDRPHLQHFLQKTVQEPPLRILVLGDSLAIGVGQRKSCTPIMPEVLAKTLSKQLGGRVVYWTCHGSPGASAGWIVRELERGVMQLSERNTAAKDEDEEEELDSLPEKMEVMSHCSDTDESSSSCNSEESSSTSSFADARQLPYSHHHHHHHRPHFIKSGVVGRDDSEIEISDDQQINSADMLTQWKKRLAQHRKRLDHPEVLGPYDIVVVLTGSNDLKGACFPFLLKGEDAEFRRQAKLRGGSYTKELRLLFDTVNERMQKRLQNIVHKVEVATESVRERVEETLEYIAPGSSHRLHSPRLGKRAQDSSPEEELSSEDLPENDEEKDERHLPLVVLPGLPARSLPIFRSFPLRWLSVPAVDIMDMHKRNFSKGNPGEVLFVPAPSVHDLVEYEEKTGEIWHQWSQEDTLLTLRDTRKKDCRRIEGFMRKYYESRSTGHRSVTEPPAGLFSIDGVHPSDDGYDFWGRYIGNHVAKELLKAKKTV